MKEQAVIQNQFNTLLKAPQIVAKPLCAIFKKGGRKKNKTKTQQFGVGNKESQNNCISTP